MAYFFPVRVSKEQSDFFWQSHDIQSAYDEIRTTLIDGDHCIEKTVAGSATVDAGYAAIKMYAHWQCHGNLAGQAFPLGL